MAVKIFINYRREDSIATAGRLRDRLAQTFGQKNLFMDVDSIPAGVDFVADLNRQVAACDVILVVIGPNWLNARDESGRRRLDNLEDFVAIEIAAALTRDIRVIPVLVDGAHIPKASELPDPIKPLARRNAVEIRNSQFGRDAEALIENIRRALNSDSAASRSWRGKIVVAATALTLLLLVGAGGYAFLGHLVEQGVQRAELKLEEERKVAEAEANRKVTEAAAKAEQDRQAKAAQQAEEKRKADEAEQQRLAAIKAEQDRQAKAAQQAEEKRKAEQQRLIYALPVSRDGLRRVALVIGNSAYQNAPILPNPERDARSIADAFQNAGYEVVTTAFNVGNFDFKSTIRKFEDTATNADIAVIYYAGHGLDINGTNYLIPIDAKFASDRDTNYETITVERLVESVHGAKRLRVIILDACRDNPFVRTRQAQRMASFSGLGAVQPNSIDTLIGYAAKPGTTAQDGGGDHSPFAAALIDNLFVPGLDIRLAFGRVRDEVLKKTGYTQEPFVYGSLGGGNVALVPASSQPVVDLEGEKADYALVEKIGTKAAWQVFLNQHPTGFYADQARAQLKLLELAK